MKVLLYTLSAFSLMVYSFPAASADQPNNSQESPAIMSEAHHHGHDHRVHIEDYRPYSHLLPTTGLSFDIKSESDVTISSILRFAPNPDARQDGSLVLYGAPASRPKGDNKPTMELLDIRLDGEPLDASRYVRKGEELRIADVPQGEFTLEIRTRINPAANKENSGLYLAGDKLLTQCESTGFRNITFYPDRPDVLSVYTTTIIGDAERFKVHVYDAAGEKTGEDIGLLSNGDEVPGSRKVLADGRTSITYLDATPKNSYLFALGAGEFDSLRDTYTIGGWRKPGEANPIPDSRAGQTVKLEVYVEPGDHAKGRHAMESLKKSMELDERLFDREYDIATYRMAATDVFNFGAMENKGFNIFNSSAMLADPHIATDTFYQRVFDVVAHEYAHNWSGNLVTVKDWFEITLKEGFTNFREKIFASAVMDPDVKRIQDVVDLRSRQFPEDASPNAKPIRPSSYTSINNMYGPTIYDKGAEVIRMMQTLVGEEVFKRAVNHYFDSNKGKAIRSDDFVAAIEHVSGMDLAQFKDTWYNQAGTPELTVTDRFDAAARTYVLTVEQFKPKVNAANFPKDDPYHIPIKMGLLDRNGNDIPLELAGDDALTNGDVLNLRQRKQTFTFRLPKGVSEKPLPSLLRGFSAPVRLKYDYSRDDLVFLLNHDSDNFNRWEAGNQLATDILVEQVKAIKAGKDLPVDGRLIDTYRNIIADGSLSGDIKATLVSLPTNAYITGMFGKGEVDVDAIKAAFDKVRQTVAVELESGLKALYQANTDAMHRPYAFTQADVAERQIRHAALWYLLKHPQNAEYVGYARAEYDAQGNKTDVVAGMSGVINHGTPEMRDAVLADYYGKWKDVPLNVNTWFGLQAGADRPDLLDAVKALTEHPAYDKENPNIVRALLGTFGANKARFHRPDGASYVFLAEKVLEADSINGKLSSGIVGPLLDVEKYDDARREKMLASIEHIASQPHLTDDLREMVDNVLKEVKPEALERAQKAREAAEEDTRRSA